MLNHCRDCNSDYATPGTCNCFAPGGKRDPERALHRLYERGDLVRSAEQTVPPPHLRHIPVDFPRHVPHA